MRFTKKQMGLLFFGFVSIYLAAWITQTHFLIENDNLWLLRLSSTILRHHGNYWHNFFETNPPLAILLYAPELILEKLLPLSHITGLRIYFFLCATLSIRLCYTLIKKIFLEIDSNVALVFLLTLTFVFLILPNQALGQREHFYVLLSTPYLLLTVCRMEKKTVSLGLAIVIGVLGAIGFSIKPYFLATFILIELYTLFVLSKKNVRKTGSNLAHLIRPETLCVLLFLLLYLLVIFIFFQPYLFKIIPISMRFYYGSIVSSWQLLLLAPINLFCLLSFLAYFLLYKKIRQIFPGFRT